MAEFRISTVTPPPLSMIPINESIVLTSFIPEDKTTLIRYMNDEELYANTLRVPSPYTESDADQWLSICETERILHGQTHNWAIRLQNNGLIGGIGCMLTTGLDGHMEEIGYWLGKPFRGQGWMTEVVQGYVQYLFGKRPNLVRIEAHVFPHNPASARVLEKSGFKQEGYLSKYRVKNGIYLDSMLFSRIREGV